MTDLTPYTSALISLEYPLPKDKVERLIEHITVKTMSDPAALALFVSNSTFDGYSADVDFYVITRNLIPQQEKGHQLYNGIPFSIVYIPLSVLLTPNPERIPRLSPGPNDRVTLLGSIAVARMIKGAPEIATLHRQLLDYYKTVRLTRKLIEIQRLTGRILLDHLSAPAPPLIREWTALQFFRTVGEGLCHIYRRKISSRRMLAKCQAVAPRDWTAASLTFLALENVDQTVMYETFIAVRNYLRRHEIQLRTWQQWPNHVTAELYYDAAARLADAGKNEAAMYCLRVLISKIQPRLNKPLPITLHSVLLPATPNWSARLIAGEKLLSGLDPMLVTKPLPRGW